MENSLQYLLTQKTQGEKMNETPIEVWERCLKFIKDNLNGRAFETWFIPIKPIKLSNNVLTIEVPSTFYYEYLEENYIDLLSTSLRKELGKDAKLEYSVVMDNSIDSDRKSINLPAKDTSDLKSKYNKINEQSRDENNIRNPFIIPGIKNIQIDSQLNPLLTFNNFVEGECNKLGRSAGLTVAENPGKTAFNPLFIYSDAGLGKSHLCHSIGLEIKEHHPKKTVLYVDALTFETQFTESTRKNTRNDFLHFYQMIDVLIIDDVHELAGKPGTQNALFQVFNYLHQKNKQIILSSDKPPIELQGMEKRLLSRFKWGLSAELSYPDLQTRIEILKKKIYNDGLDIKDEIIEYIANNATSSIREMEGTLISLLAQSTLTRKEINIGLAKNVVDKLVKNTKKDLSIEDIQEQVCEYFNIPPDQLKSKTRKREIVQSRQIAMYFAKNLTKSSLATIGAKIGGKDHATVLHACKTVNNLIETDKRFKNYIDDIQKRFK
jgi:chromosomal replication initiator protein